MVPTAASVKRILDLEPVTTADAGGPMRVVYRHVNGILATRIFPNAARAADFALTQREVIRIEDPTKSPAPEQDHAINRSIINFRRSGPTVARILGGRA